MRYCGSHTSVQHFESLALQRCMYVSLSIDILVEYMYALPPMRIALRGGEADMSEMSQILCLLVAGGMGRYLDVIG